MFIFIQLSNGMQSISLLTQVFWFITEENPERALYSKQAFQKALNSIYEICKGYKCSCHGAKKKNLRWKIHESKLNETECTAHNILSR